MEIEAKLVLATKEDLLKAETLFSRPGEGQMVELENYFYDSATDALRKEGIMFRLRLSNASDNAEINIKSHAEIDQGSTCRFASNVSLTREQALRCRDNPSMLLEFVPEFRTQHNITELKFLGGFRTKRMSITATILNEPISLKLDEVMYQFGNHYELEISCNNQPLQDVYAETERLLKLNGISAKMGTQSKYHTFVQGCNESLLAPTSMRP
eukprot:TRINITY_DN478_c2_g1_i1.p1 TRINITY_DN478_c2_g1~~TRINITY_DN478_c2_g1_i1.p1  ORF type:complete len:234 (+),score=33.81 TRINITY_DN478_c2_g1_i1:68-703(+)